MLEEIHCRCGRERSNGSRRDAGLVAPWPVSPQGCISHRLRRHARSRVLQSLSYHRHPRLRNRRAHLPRIPAPTDSGSPVAGRAPHYQAGVSTTGEYSEKEVAIRTEEIMIGRPETPADSVRTVPAALTLFPVAALLQGDEPSIRRVQGFGGRHGSLELLNSCNS